MASSVVLVHGWGGSFATTWQQSGFTALLEDGGKDVIGVDLLGHGTAAKPHDPAAYADLTGEILAALPDEPVEAVGFSLGALTLLRAAVAHPERFSRLVLAGIGRNVLEPDDSGTAQIVAALDQAIGGGETDSLGQVPRLFVQYAEQNGNDIRALAAVMKRPRGSMLDATAIGTVQCPVLVVVGDQDFVHPGDELAALFPDGRCETLRKVDHFATPEAFGFFDATLEFLDAI
ncbi:MAG: alpha/beta fold hydrolase [Ilumatobacter sp.]|nr:alpha/beta fold hydrolase [Ilumatobacter sp.]